MAGTVVEVALPRTAVKPAAGPPGARIAAPTVLLYSHDSYGLGHLRRTLKIAGCFRARWPGARQLVVSGTPMLQACAMPDGADCLKLPAVVKVGRDEYAARTLPLRFEAIRDLRSALLLGAVRHFEPDLLLVDHSPGGMGGELVPALEHVRRASPRTRVVLGLRDVVDDAERVRAAWTAGGIYDLLERLYDRIVVYGQRDVYDATREYDFSPSLRAKTGYAGYLRSKASRSPAAVRAELGLRAQRLVVVTAGGGGDGFRLLEAALAAAGAPGAAEFELLVVGGPLLPPEQRARLLATRVAGSVRFVDYVDDLVDYLAAADVVVSMGGYNSVSEILSLGRPAIVVPRVEPRREQLIRARLLARRGLLHVLHPAELTPERLRSEIERALSSGRPSAAAAAVALDGLATVAEQLDALLYGHAHNGNGDNAVVSGGRRHIGDGEGYGAVPRP